MAAEKIKPVKGKKEEGKPTIGIIGGSGLYGMPGLTDTKEVRVKTPFGDPSEVFVIGTLEGKRVAFLARHGRGHRILPGEINYRANVYAMKALGVERIISVSAVGSLQEDLRPGEIFGRRPICGPHAASRIHFFWRRFGGARIVRARPRAANFPRSWPMPACIAGVPVHRKGTYICMEGPQFSTYAEATMHRQLHFEVIGMTNAHPKRSWRAKRRFATAPSP